MIRIERKNRSEQGAPPYALRKPSRPAHTKSRDSGLDDSGLFRAEQFVGHAPPANFAGEERVSKIQEVEEWNQNGQQNVNPGLPHNFGSPGVEGFRHADKPEGAADGGKENRKKSQGHQVKRRSLLEEVA